MRVTYRYLPPTSVFFARGFGPYRSSCNAAWQRLDAWLDESGARRRVRQAFGIFHDNPRTTAPELVRYDACVPARSCADIEPGRGIHRQTLPGGACAVHVHTGPYANTAQLFSRLHTEMVPKRGLTIDYGRPFLAIYLNDPRTTPEVHRRTELCIPVVPMPMSASSNDDSLAASDAIAIARRLAS
jgi:AraC family transcriptional regulator